MVTLIEKKRDGLALSGEEIRFFVEGYTSGAIPDYQASALLMAIVLRGMTAEETTRLTLAMANSGQVLDLSQVTPIAVDKHSTGGVGDKTTLVAEPIVAACGLPVGKMSGRGLGFSGGTIDKMESIPGFRTNLTTNEFLRQLQSIGLVLTGQSVDLAPADGKMYALRDVTGTVQSIPLIASSIMSKKIAAGANAILLDVKVGVGAFMQTEAEARALAEMMVSIARLAGRQATALLADMNQPLGIAVGNALELKEAIRTLQGNGPADFREHCLTVAGYMLALGGKADDPQVGREMAEAALKSGVGWAMFRRLVMEQGGDVTYVDNPSRLPTARIVQDIPATRSGYLRAINARIVGETAVMLGAGRMKKGDPIDYGVGIEIWRKVGDQAKRGETLFTVYANDEDKAAQAIDALHGAHEWSEAPVAALPLFYGIVV
jgi:pyrimidine-nucleoside phosphorylase